MRASVDLVMLIAKKLSVGLHAKSTEGFAQREKEKDHHSGSRCVIAFGGSWRGHLLALAAEPKQVW